MAEYIEKEKVQKDFIEHFCNRTNDVYIFIDDILRFIEDEPASEGTPVKHGRWIMTVYTTRSKRGRIISNKKFKCSECGCGNGRKQSNHCPNCGAKMDGAENE